MTTIEPDTTAETPIAANRRGAPRKLDDHALVEAIANGMSNAAIAAEFDVAERTVSRRRNDPEVRVQLRRRAHERSQELQARFASLAPMAIGVYENALVNGDAKMQLRVADMVFDRIFYNQQATLADRVRALEEAEEPVGVPAAHEWPEDVA